MMPKTKISVTVDRSLILDCDRLSRGASRSEVVESALAAWLRERRRRSLEAEIEKYYSSLSAAERKEDSRWADLAGRSARGVWK
jgi:metal-responsive CopG/Arc/MetJ family transcriptional regulator